MRILVVKLSALGDQIHLCPAVADIRRALPSAEIDWAVQTEFAAIASMHQDVSKVFALPLQAVRLDPFSLSKWKDLLRVIRVIRSNYYDVVIDAQGVLKSAVLTRLVRRETVIGISRPNQSEQGAGFFYSRQFLPGSGLSAVTRLRGLVGAGVGIGPTEPPEFRLIPPALTDGLRGIHSAVFLVPCASTPLKHWPVDHWISLITKLKPSAQTFFLVWGSEAERTLVGQIAAKVGRCACPLPERKSLSELAGILKVCRLVVGVDSGITHLANAIGTPTIMIFCSTRPELFFTPGSALSVGVGDYQSSPSLEEVLTHCDSILKPQ